VSHRKTSTVLVAGALGLLAACGTPQAAPPAGAGSPTATSGGQATEAPADGSQESKASADSVRFENLMADCMKAKGFTYVPRPLTFEKPSDNQLGKDPSLVPYDALKKFRSKYGFGHFAADVYPHDRNVAPEPLKPNPNTAIRDALDETGKKAYDEAFDGGYVAMKQGGSFDRAKHDASCSGKVSLEVYGPEKPADPAAAAKAAQVQQEYQNDPDLLQAAQGYANCLRGLGYEVGAVKPGVIDWAVEQAALNLYSAAQGANLQQGLDHEIKMALDDLECGKDYRVVAAPKVAEVLAEGGVG